MSSVSSVFVQLAAVLQALLESPPIEGVGAFVTRDRLAPVIKENKYAINVRLDKAVCRRGATHGSPDDWITDYDVECMARAPADKQPTDVVDPLLVAVFARLADAGARPELVALAVEDALVDPQVEWDLGEANTPQAAATVSVRIVHRTLPGQLLPWPA